MDPVLGSIYITFLCNSAVKLQGSCTIFGSSVEYIERQNINYSEGRILIPTLLCSALAKCFLPLRHLYFTPIFTYQTVAWSLLLKLMTQLVQGNLGYKEFTKFTKLSCFLFSSKSGRCHCQWCPPLYFLYTWISCTYISILWELKCGVDCLCHIMLTLPLRSTGVFTQGRNPGLSLGFL